MQRYKSVIAEHYPQDDERQERRDSNAGRHIVQPDAQQDDGPDEDEEKCCHFLSVANVSNTDTCC